MDLYRVYYKGYVDVEAESEEEAIELYSEDDFFKRGSRGYKS